ncbi:hypothetical protein LOZ65_006891 [Ophidiomyces ophidiicola]|nr:hypothetical protein LOZ65_006891 [Ophidiomyces ophidiicola]
MPESWIGRVTCRLKSLLCDVFPGDCLFVNPVQEIECPNDTDQEGIPPPLPPKEYRFPTPPSYQNELLARPPPCFPGKMGESAFPAHTLGLNNVDNGKTGDLNFGLRQAKSSKYELPMDVISTKDAPPTPPPSPVSPELPQSRFSSDEDEQDKSRWRFRTNFWSGRSVMA